MPIRFRCAYCNQLLGISRRKAGTVVRCPTCAGQVVVPNALAEDNEDGPGRGDQLVFERSDFDELLNPGGGPVALPGKEGAVGQSEAQVAAPLAPAAHAAGWATETERAPEIDAGPAPAASVGAEPLTATAGIFLSPARATLLAVAVVVALALAFGGGVLVGYYLGSSQEVKHTQEQ